MSTLSVRLPNSLHNMVKAIAQEDSISINQFIASAVAEKLSAINTENILKADQLMLLLVNSRRY